MAPTGWNLDQWWRERHRAGHRQHEFVVSLRDAITLLSSTCGHNGLFEDLCCKSLETSRTYSGGDGANSTGKRQRKTHGLDRIQHGPTSADGKIPCQQRSPKSVGMQMVLKNLHNNRQDGYTLLGIVGSGVSLGDPG